ncbi:MAG: dockerin type I domain-containing protein, partial [Clostridiales bacterium]|nr:dockerin type I domain-containing protein [Clostridiales bacterium]
LAQSGSNWVGQRFTNPNAATLYGGGPVIADAMYVKRMREMVNEADAKGWTGISAANRSRLELLEPMAIDVRIAALPLAGKIVYGHMSTVNELYDDYCALTEAQKAQVKGTDTLLAAKARIDALASSVLVYLSADAESDIDKNAEFTLSISHATNLLTLEAEIVADGSMLAGVGVEPLNGFKAMSDIFWRYLGGDLWAGTVTLAYKAGDSEGFTAYDPADIARFIFAPRAIGDTELKLATVKAAGLVGDTTQYLATLIEEGVAATNIDQRTFSKYDLNRDNKVDALDLGIMLLYCGFAETAPGWNSLVKVNDSRGKGVTASMCDVNGDGIIDMLDLLDLFIHYTK